MATPLTYEPFYGLSENPFSLSSDTRFIYHGASHDRVLQELTDALERGETLMVLTGGLGVGKTTLCRVLIEHLGRRTVASLTRGATASFDDLLKSVLVDFGIDTARGRIAAATREELVAVVGDFAASLTPLHASALIIVDDADDLGAELLEALALLSDLDADRRVQMILVGQPGLARMLRQKALQPLDRRVSVRCGLEPLTSEEVVGYVEHRLATAGAKPRVEFSDGAYSALHAATGGVPRLVNLVCDRALTRGQELSSSVIDVALIAAAAADLELGARQTGVRRALRIAFRAILFAALMLAGAAAAAWVFRALLSQFWGG